MAKNGNLGRLFNLPPEQAVNFLDAKVSKETWSWTEVWEKAHETTFTIAKTLDADVLEDLRLAVESALNNGTPFKQFQKDIEPILKSKGWWGSALTPEGEVVHLGTPWRLETIFRTNILSSYQAGRQNQMKEVLERPNSRFKYKQYVAVRDSRTRPNHAQLNGRVFPADHSFWHTHTPPNGFNCRCDVILLTQRQYEAIGSPGLEDGKMKEAEVTLSKKTGKTAIVSVYEDANGKLFPTDPGFSHSPNAKFKPDLDKYKPPVKNELKKSLEKKPKATKKDADGWTPPLNHAELVQRFEAFYDSTQFRAEFSIGKSLNFKALSQSLKAVETIYKQHPYLKKLFKITTKASSFKGKGKNAVAHAHFGLFEMNGSKDLWKKGTSSFVQGKEWTEEKVAGLARQNAKVYELEEMLKNSTLSMYERMQINIRLKDAKEWVERYKEALNFDRWTYGISKELEPYNTAIHEFGHILHDQLIEGINKGRGNFRKDGTINETGSSPSLTREQLSYQMKNKWEKMFKDILALEKNNPQRFNEIRRNVSQYAFTDEHEFFAETFVMYHNKVPSLDGFVKDFMDALFTNDLKAWEVYLNKREGVK